MKYLDYINDEIKEYYMILCNSDYPYFIDKYINTKDLKRLGGIGQFCGCDYTKIFNCKYWYSRLHHSIACALMIWNFTKNKEQTIAALFHDLGTPAFSHCIDFLLNDPVNQESSELNVKEIINNSIEIKKLLKSDNIDIEDINDVAKYTIMENKKPKICVDRLEGILHTGLIWIGYWNINDISKMYKNIIVLKNENNEDEIGFKNKYIAEKFYSGAYKYSIVLQQNEDIYVMKTITKNLNFMLDKKIINKDDLYIMSEKEIINNIKSLKELKNDWDSFSNYKKIYRTNSKPKKEFYEYMGSKKRYVVPLVKYKKETVRLDKVSNRCVNLLNKYLKYEDSKYYYVKEEL